MDNLQGGVWKQTNDVTSIPQFAYRMAAVLICQSSNPSCTCREFLAQHPEEDLDRIIFLKPRRMSRDMLHHNSVMFVLQFGSLLVAYNAEVARELDEKSKPVCI